MRRKCIMSFICAMCGVSHSCINTFRKKPKEKYVQSALTFPSPSTGKLGEHMEVGHTQP